MSQREYEILSFGRFEKPRSPTPGKGEDLILDSHEGAVPVFGVADGVSSGRGDLAKVIVDEEFAKWNDTLKPGIDMVASIEGFVAKTQNRLLAKAKEVRERSVETTLSLAIPHDNGLYLLNIGENICNVFDCENGSQYEDRVLMGAYNPSFKPMHLGSRLFEPGNLLQKGYLQQVGLPGGGLYRVVLGTDGMYCIEGGKSEFFRFSRDRPAEEIARQLKAGMFGKIPLQSQTDDMAFIGADLRYKRTAA